MAGAHINTVLPIKNRVLAADEHTAFLAHYDLNEHDVLRGVKASGQVAAMSLDGSVGSYAQVEYSNDILDSMPQLTLEARVKSRSVTGSFGRVISIWAPQQAYQLFIHSGGVAFELRGTGGSKWFSGGSNITTDNQWHHIAAVYNGQEMIIYLDGTEVARQSAVFGSVANVTSNTVGIGSYNNGQVYGMNAEIAEVRIWSIARTPEEIKQFLNQSVSAESRGLRGYWKGNEGEGNVLRDSSPFKNDAVIYNGTWTSGNSVFTLRPEEGKFGGAIAIEESTTNLVPDGHLANYPGNGHWVPDSGPDYLDGKGLKISSGSKSNYYLRSGMAVTAGDVYTLTARAYVSPDYDAGLRSVFCLDSGGIHYNLNGTKKGEWEVVSLTFTVSTTGTMSVGPYNSSTFTAGHVKIDWIQLEKKAFATSFVDGTRSPGNLVYPPNIFNHDEGTINLWVASVHDVNVMASGTGNGGGDRPFIYPAQGSDWSVDGGVFLWYLNDGDGLYSLFAGRTLSGADNLRWPANEWHMVSINWSKSQNFIKMYLDGQPNASADFPLSGWNNKVPYKLGHINSNFLFDELRIDKVARTDEEIAAWYESNSPFWPRGIYRKSY